MQRRGKTGANVREALDRLLDEAKRGSAGSRSSPMFFLVIFDRSWASSGDRRCFARRIAFARARLADAARRGLAGPGGDVRLLAVVIAAAFDGLYGAYSLIDLRERSLRRAFGMLRDLGRCDGRAEKNWTAMAIC